MRSIAETMTPPVTVGRHAPDIRSAVELVLLGAIWGSSFLFMRVAAPDFGPVPLVQTRLLLGALVLSPMLWRVRASLRWAHLWRLLIIGALSSAIPFVLFAWGAERAPAGIGAITNSMTALFTPLVAFAAFSERIGGRRMIGLLAGFAGVVVLASGHMAGAEIGWATLAGTLATLCYGIAANLIKRFLSDLPPIAVAAGTLVSAAMLTLPLALLTWPSHPIPAHAWAAAASLGMLCTGLAYAFYFRLIRRIGASRASTTTYLVPLFGMTWAWLFLSEPVTPTMLLAALLIVGGVLLSQREAAARTTQATEA